MYHIGDNNNRRQGYQLFWGRYKHKKCPVKREELTCSAL